MTAEQIPAEPPHRLYALTTAEITRYRHELEHAVKRLGAAPVVADLQAKLAEVLAEQAERRQIYAHISRQ
jgi:hypothetical protein